MSVTGFLIEDLADRVGQYAWWERRLASVLADWACDEAEARARLHFHVLGRQAETHAFIWEVMLPDSPALTAAERVAPPPAWKDWSDTRLAGLPSTFERLVVLNEALLSALLESLDDFTAGLSLLSEGPELRHADLIGRDLRYFKGAGEELMAGLLAESTDPEFPCLVAAETERLRPSVLDQPSGGGDVR